MKIGEELNKDLKEKAIKILNESSDKSDAIAQVIDMIATEKNKDLITELQNQAKNTESSKNYANKLGLRVLSKEEEKFYESFKDIKQAVNGNQIDFIPTSIIDITLEDVKVDEPVLKLIDFAPADVKRWISAEKKGVYSWEGLTEKLKGQITSDVKGLVTDLGKLNTYLIIPKAISELSYPFMDKYFTAIINETLKAGLSSGYIGGTGKDQPIGIMKKIDAINEDGTHQDKSLNIITGFSPKQLAPAKVYLTNGGKRNIDKLYLVCNPEDEANYVDPALFNKEGNMISSFKNLEKVPCTECPKGKAAFTLEHKYTMGMNGYQIQKYVETLALDDADLLAGKIYANGRAVADNVAYVFDVTKLEEYVPEVKTIAVASEVAGA